RPGRCAAVDRVLWAREESGRRGRGDSVDGLGASRFAPVEAVDRLRDRDREAEAERGPDETAAVIPAEAATVALAATDPGNPYGAALPWPPLPIAPPEGVQARPARRAGALVLLADGHVLAVVDRGAKHLLWWADEASTSLAAEQLVRAIAEDSRLPQLRIERINGHGIDSPAVSAVGAALGAAGCYRSPKSIRLRAGGR